MFLFFENGSQKVKQDQVQFESSPALFRVDFLSSPNILGKIFTPQDRLGGLVLPSSLPWWSSEAQECWPLRSMARPVCSLLEWAAWEVLISRLLRGARCFLKICIHWWDKLSNHHPEVSSKKKIQMCIVLAYSPQSHHKDSLKIPSSIYATLESNQSIL